MKLRTLYPLVLLCISLSINAQRDNHAHAYSAGDKVERHHVAFKHFEALGKNAVWGLSDIELSDKTIDGMMICHQSFDDPDTKACRFSQSLSSHPHGVYILTISVGGQQFSEKFAYQ